MDLMMGNLFLAGHVQPSEIESMNARRMTYWNEWVMLMEKEQRKAASKAGK